MPDGAQTRDLVNITKFRNYLSANVENWYRFANGYRGLGLRNGDLRLVVGYDKGASWGMAVVSNNSGLSQPDRRLRFKAVDNEGTGHGNNGPTSYIWVPSGLVDTQAGPGAEETAILGTDDPSPPQNGKYENQALFIRTLNATLEDNTWTQLQREMGIEEVDGGYSSELSDDHLYSRSGGHLSASASSSRMPSAERGSRRSSERGRSTQKACVDLLRPTAISSLNSEGNSLLMTHAPTAMVSPRSIYIITSVLIRAFEQRWHPANSLNKALLSQAEVCVFDLHNASAL